MQYAMKLMITLLNPNFYCLSLPPCYVLFHHIDLLIYFYPEKNIKKKTHAPETLVICDYESYLFAIIYLISYHVPSGPCTIVIYFTSYAVSIIAYSLLFVTVHNSTRLKDLFTGMN